MKSFLYFHNGNREEINETKQLCNRVAELKEKNINFKYQLNSSLGRWYFEDFRDFQIQMKNLHKEQIAFFPMVESSPGCWNSLNLHKKLARLK